MKQTSRRAGIPEPFKRLPCDASSALDEARAAHAALPAAGRLEAEAGQARAALAAARAQDAAAARALDSAIRDGSTRRARMAALAREREAWAVRAANARLGVAGLRTRLAEADAEHARLCAAQIDLAAAERDGTAGVPEAEVAHRAAVALAEAEHGATTAARAAQAAAAALAGAREDPSAPKPPPARRNKPGRLGRPRPMLQMGPPQT